MSRICEYSLYRKVKTYFNVQRYSTVMILIKSQLATVFKHNCFPIRLSTAENSLIHSLRATDDLVHSWWKDINGIFG